MKIKINSWSDGGSFTVSLARQHPCSRREFRLLWAGVRYSRRTTIFASWVKTPARTTRDSRRCWMSALLFLLVSAFWAHGQTTNPLVRLDTNAAPRPITNAAPQPETNAGPAITTAAPPRKPTAPGRQDYSSFKIISDRNIFNASRSARSSQAGGGTVAKTAKIETFSLVGTLSFEKGRFAFFDGTSSQFKQALHAADTIAGYKIAEIAPNHVKLESAGKEITLNVGMQMRRQDEGQWSVVAASESATNSGGAAAPAGSGSSSSAGDDDVLKKLMQQREQELNK